jgi:DEAD/DEAH box helicase domain-containing protein
LHRKRTEETPTNGSDLLGIVADAARNQRVRHVQTTPARPGTPATWPLWVDPIAIQAWAKLGIDRPWQHQRTAMDLAWQRHHLVIATGTASGKSLAYLAPAVTAASGQVPSTNRGSASWAARGSTILYLSPTKALAADQHQRLAALGLERLRSAVYDGDTVTADRVWIREHANYILTNPDMLHYNLMPDHRRWSRFLRNLDFIIIDECHYYRGVFGAHTAAVIRRLRRLLTHYQADPTFILVSATQGDPAEHATALTGLSVTAVTDDLSAQGEVAVALWDPPNLVSGRPSAQGEVAELLADFVAAGVQTLAFVASRRGVESVAQQARQRLAAESQRSPALIASYRGGYLPEERRALERALRSADIMGLAATNALELGIDISGLDVVLLAGWPGRLAALRQQIGRAGRALAPALAILVAADDPLDAYLLRHPEAIFDAPLERTTIDPSNPYVLAPHLAAAAAELPLTEHCLPIFGPAATHLVAVLTDSGVLRQRPTGWFWTRSDRAVDHVNLRSTGERALQLVEQFTGRIIGTVDAAAADRNAHPGAIYLHQGEAFMVQSWDVDAQLAFLTPADSGRTTIARSTIDIHLANPDQSLRWGPATINFGTAQVTSKVVSYRLRGAAGENLGEFPLELPPRDLTTKAMWWTVSASIYADWGIDAATLPGALHAAEHAAIALLPLVATCDRWDIGGVSTVLQRDTGQPTVVVYDGYQGGAGIAERGFALMEPWIGATREVLATCTCSHGCPACIQSPKCGNGNDPLNKAGALRVLELLWSHRTHHG